MSIASNFPTIRPSLNLDFANTKVLDPRITFTRASTATHYDGKTTAKAEENLLTYSQEFDNAAWLKGNTATVVANSQTAPDGTTTADTLTMGATPTNDMVYQVLTVPSGATVTISVFAKKNVGDWFRFFVGSGSNYFICSFDLQNGTVGTPVNVGTGVVVSTSISPSANGFYRVSITGYIPSTTSYPVGMFIADADNSGVRLANGSAYIWGAQLEQRSSVTAYTATTTQAITNYVPVLQTAAANVARFDHNPTTGESLGLLIEEQRTNLLTYSNAFTTAPWTDTRAVTTSNAVTSPDGTVNGFKITQSSGQTVAGGVNRSDINYTTSTKYTYTCYAKKGEKQFLQLLENGTTNGTANRTYFNLNSGTVGTTSGSHTAAISNAGNGWYRCSITFTAVGTFTSLITAHMADTDGSTTVTDSGGIYIWGAQLEVGAFPTSYTPTTTAQVTRSADAATMTGTNFSSWYRADEGTIYTEGQINFAPIGGGGVAWYSIDETAASSTRAIQPYFSNSTGTLLSYVVNSSEQANTGNTVISANTNFKYAQVYKVNDFASVVNGGTVATDTSGTVPITVDRLVIGHFAVSGNRSRCYKKIAYYPLRVTNANLQALTS